MAPSQYPRDRLYHAQHVWARDDDSGTRIGITWFAQDALGEIVYIELPKAATRVTGGAPYAQIESLKAISDVYSPISGVVVEVNEKLDQIPELLNDDPYGDGWIAIVLADADWESDKPLMGAEEYASSVTRERDGTSR